MDKKKMIILLATIIVCAAVLGVAGALIFRSMASGKAFDKKDNNNVQQAEVTPVAEETVPPETEEPNVIEYTTPAPEIVIETPDPNVTPEPEPTPEPVDPYAELMEKADTSMMKNIVNILLVGVDYATERETWNGKKEWHSDVMMVLAVNFDENRADLISLPRDTYAQIPDVKGIYKLNASINCGGGLYNNDGSFNPKSLEKVCDSAEWMLGGIDVDYYYAVTMTSLKDLVDLCGGVDYDMDISFTIQGRHYDKGMQHIDGQGFLDYCRVRKTSNGLTASQAGDAKRVERQKKMLVALFNQMQADRLITKIPEIIETFDGDLFTNCNFSQTAALAAFAYNLDSANIGMYSMSGDTRSLYQWNFCFTDQKNRVNIIKQVYGVDAKQYTKYTLSYARYNWCDMLYPHYMELIEPLTKYVQNLIDEDDKLPEFTPEPTEEPTPTPEEPTPTPTPDESSPTPTPTPEEPTPTATPDNSAPDPTPEQSDPGDDSNAAEPAAPVQRAIYYETDPFETRKYTPEQRELFETYKTALKDLDELKKKADAEAKKARNGKTNSLNSVGQEYLKMLEDVQNLAIEVAKTFEYTKVKDFTKAFSPTATGWGSSPWAFNYGKDKKLKINEIIVDFN